MLSLTIRIELGIEKACCAERHSRAAAMGPLAAALCLLCCALLFGGASAEDAQAGIKLPIHIGLKTGGGFVEGFVSSISVILVSEIGDKTFFIAAIMAMRNDRLIVFAGAIGALALMTILSAALGFATTVISRVYTFYASVLLFVVFGVKMLKEGYEMSPTHGQEELEEVNNELNKKQDEAVPDVELAKPAAKPLKSRWPFPPVLMQVFTLTFLAEWGDRSQITTIILAAQQNPYGVTLGGILGHALCTGGAVLGGRLLAQQISVRTVTLLGGVIFIGFAGLAIWQGPSVS